MRKLKSPDRLNNLVIAIGFIYGGTKRIEYIMCQLSQRTPAQAMLCYSILFYSILVQSIPVPSLSFLSISSHPIPSHLIPSHPIPFFSLLPYPIPPHPTPHYPMLSYPILSHESCATPVAFPFTSQSLPGSSHHLF